MVWVDIRFFKADAVEINKKLRSISELRGIDPNVVVLKDGNVRSNFNCQSLFTVENIAKKLGDINGIMVVKQYQKTKKYSPPNKMTYNDFMDIKEVIEDDDD